MSGAYVFIDRSQFPKNVRHDLIESLHSRVINHKFHYESYKQAAKWLALHKAYSPASADASCERAYNGAFEAAVSLVHSSECHVVGLGCGAGKKEAQLLQILRRLNRKLTYTACDVSLPLVLMAREAALPFVSEDRCGAVVCDMATQRDLSQIIGERRVESARIITLFGIVPNFEPQTLFPLIARLLGADELLLLSANLAPGDDYAVGVHEVLPQYNNELTGEWLMTLLLDLGFERNDGEMDFTVECDSRNLLRIVSTFEMKSSRDIQVFGETISFSVGERIRLFLSYRHTPHTLPALAVEHGLEIIGQWLNESQQEGVFLCRKIP